ncbi:hypothetical protein PR003_g1723 [Phytophthora rubi]|uniref:Uncharacterized protein n=1 Tax=Phytophthora rubi TaxID=129364 RepID=A0A6A4G2U1_9STRA|nr:hypothetical protein PR003_g1723 [Phytophthora rubi]
MYEAVVEAMKAAPNEPPREAWTSTIAELYAISHDKVNINEELVPEGKQRYPKLRADEKALLYKLFEEVSVGSNGSYDNWVNYASMATQDLYNTSWAFKHIMQSMISKVKWARMKPLNQWAQKVKGGGIGKRSPAARTQGTIKILCSTPQHTQRRTLRPYERYVCSRKQHGAGSDCAKGPRQNGGSLAGSPKAASFADAYQPS